MKTKLFWWFIGLINGILIALDIAFARSIDVSKAGVSLWIFLAVGTVIILLQLVPALILFFSFMGTSIHGINISEKSKESSGKIAEKLASALKYKQIKLEDL